MIEDRLGKVVHAKTGPGASKGLHVVRAYSAHPTYRLEDALGQHMTWAAHLCDNATHEEEVAYWKERALNAESELFNKKQSPRPAVLHDVVDDVEQPF